MTQFEYHSSIARPDEVLAVCNVHGKNGWELCACYQVGTQYGDQWPKFITLLFKRRKEAQ